MHAPSMSLRMARWSTTRYVGSRVTMEELRVPLQWFILFPSGAIADHEKSSSEDAGMAV